MRTLAFAAAGLGLAGPVLGDAGSACCPNGLLVFATQTVVKVFETPVAISTFFAENTHIVFNQNLTVPVTNAPVSLSTRVTHVVTETHVRVDRSVIPNHEQCVSDPAGNNIPTGAWTGPVDSGSVQPTGGRGFPSRPGHFTIPAHSGHGGNRTEPRPTGGREFPSRPGHFHTHPGHAGTGIGGTAPAGTGVAASGSPGTDNISQPSSAAGSAHPTGGWRPGHLPFPHHSGHVGTAPEGTGNVPTVSASSEIVQSGTATEATHNSTAWSTGSRGFPSRPGHLSHPHHTGHEGTGVTGTAPTAPASTDIIESGTATEATHNSTAWSTGSRGFPSRPGHLSHPHHTGHVGTAPKGTGIAPTDPASTDIIESGTATEATHNSTAWSTGSRGFPSRPGHLSHPHHTGHEGTGVTDTAPTAPASTDIIESGTATEATHNSTAWSTGGRGFPSRPGHLSHPHHSGHVGTAPEGTGNVPTVSASSEIVQSGTATEPTHNSTAWSTGGRGFPSRPGHLSHPHHTGHAGTGIAPTDPASTDIIESSVATGPAHNSTAHPTGSRSIPSWPAHSTPPAHSSPAGTWLASTAHTDTGIAATSSHTDHTSEPSTATAPAHSTTAQPTGDWTAPSQPANITFPAHSGHGGNHTGARPTGEETHATPPASVSSALGKSVSDPTTRTAPAQPTNPSLGKPTGPASITRAEPPSATHYTVAHSGSPTADPDSGSPSGDPPAAGSPSSASPGGSGSSAGGNGSPDPDSGSGDGSHASGSSPDCEPRASLPRVCAGASVPADCSALSRITVALTADAAHACAAALGPFATTPEIAPCLVPGIMTGWESAICVSQALSHVCIRVLPPVCGAAAGDPDRCRQALTPFLGAAGVSDCLGRPADAAPQCLQGALGVAGLPDAGRPFCADPAPASHAPLCLKVPNNCQQLESVGVAQAAVDIAEQIEGCDSALSAAGLKGVGGVSSCLGSDGTSESAATINGCLSDQVGRQCISDLPSDCAGLGEVEASGLGDRITACGTALGPWLNSPAEFCLLAGFTNGSDAVDCFREAVFGNSS